MLKGSAGKEAMFLPNTISFTELSPTEFPQCILHRVGVSNCSLHELQHVANHTVHLNRNIAKSLSSEAEIYGAVASER